MAYPLISIDKITPVFTKGWEEKLWLDNSFSFFLTNKAGKAGSTLTLGGVDP